jgi:hypothetical protein
MQTVVFHIHLTPENKENDQVIDILVRESGNQRFEMIEYLKTNDTITVPDMDVQHAQKLVEEFAKVGVVANFAATVDTAPVEPGSSEPWFVKPSWHWWAFFLTYLWYMFKGLWVKLTVYIMVGWLLNKISFLPSLQIIAQLGFWFYIGMYAKHDLYLKEECDEKLWNHIPWRKFKKVYFICLIVFVVFGMVLPLSSGVKNVKYSVTSIMNFGDSSQKQVTFGNYIFRSVPGTWWKFVQPPKGMDISAEKQYGNVTQTLKYQSNKNTIMMATICTTRPMSGMDNDTLGIVAVEVLKGKGTAPIDDEKIISTAINQFNIKIPVLLGFLKKFFNVEHSEPAYKEFAGRQWGRVSITREIKIAGRVAESIADVYWTLVDGDLVLVYTDAFPQHVGNVRHQTENMMRSLQPFDMQGQPVLASSGDINVTITATSSSTIVSSGGDGGQYSTVREAVRAGQGYLANGDRANAQKCLDRAIALVGNEDDYKQMEEFARAMAQ